MIAKSKQIPPAQSLPDRVSASLPLDGFTRWKGLKSLVPVSRETIRKRESEGRFPRRQHLSQRCAVWPNRELHRWFADPVNYKAEV